MTTDVSVSLVTLARHVINSSYSVDATTVTMTGCVTRREDAASARPAGGASSVKIV